jgi:hypothetical protein
VGFSSIGNDPDQSVSGEINGKPNLMKMIFNKKQFQSG